MSNILGVGSTNIFGGPIQPPGPIWANPLVGLSKVVTTGISLTLVTAGLFVLVYAGQGALDWITSGGEEEKLEKARLKLTNAALGIVILVAVLGFFTVITGDVLGIIRRDAFGNWQFEIPTLQQCVKSGDPCVQSSSSCCVGTQTCKQANPASIPPDPYLCQ